MIILGLTGSIGMGKSTVSGVFQSLGIPVHEADKAVHELLSDDSETIKKLEAEFPGVTSEGSVDRQVLSERVFGDEAALKRLEDILHPLVHHLEQEFLRKAALAKRPLVVLEIPLLYETGAEDRCDAVVVVSAPPFVQEARVLKRPGMTRERLEFIRRRQMPDMEKRRKADFIVPTGLGHAFSLRAVEKIVKVARQLYGSK